MQKRQRLFALISVFALLAGSAFAQEGVNKSSSTTDRVAGSSPEAGRGPTDGREIQLTDLLAQARPKRRAGFSLMPSYSLTPMAAGPTLPVLGGGTLGRLTKWSGFTSSNSFIGDSTIFESKIGLVGIGTDSPTSRLTVAGLIETTSGGFKFPDGTVQTTAGISFVTHDASLMGLGTAASPLGIAPGGVNTIHLADQAVTAAKIANGTVVRSFNGLFDNVSLLAGSNITITPAGNTLTIAAPNVLSSVVHNSTLTGDGTAASPLGVAAGGIDTAQLADGAVTLSKIAVNQVLTSLNGLRENVNLVAGPNITITPSSNTLTIAGTGGASTVAYHAVSEIIGALDAPGATVVSKQVPEGSYFISFRIRVNNHDDSPQDLSCTLSTGDSTTIRLAGDDALGGILVLQDVATFQAPATISVHCIGFQMVVFGKTTLTALKVGSIQ